MKRILLCLFGYILLTGCASPVTYVERGDEWTSFKSDESPNTKLFSPGDILIVLDAGHGGKDSGAKSTSAPLTLEKNLNLKTAQYVNYYLKKFGFQTALTRNDDTFIPLDKRAGFANSLGSQLFVSIHFNSAKSQKAEGVEIFYYKSQKDSERTKESKLLGENIMTHIEMMTHSKSRGVKHGDYAVVRETLMPAILIEGGFMTNKNEMQNLRDDIYLKKLAWGIASGVREYVLGAN